MNGDETLWHCHRLLYDYTIFHTTVFPLKKSYLLQLSNSLVNILAVAILPSMAIYSQRLFCRELFVIDQS